MFKIVKKTELPPLYAALLRIGAAVCALIAASLIMLILGYNPVDVYLKIIEGSAGTAYRVTETINKTIPLAVMSLGIAVAFKMKFWNIGAEGQFYMGAFAAAYVAFALPGLPGYILLPLMMMASIVFGGLWALIAALLKSKFGTSETLVTLMLNYIAIKWITYLQYGPWRDPKASGFPRMSRFVDAAVLPELFGVHIGWIVTLILAVLIFVLMKNTKLGYEIAVIGESEATARYAGISVVKTVLISMLISGGLCGLAGMMQASAIEGSLSDQMSGGLGFTAIITTWLARLSPPMVLVVSFLFAMLLQGGAYIQSALQIPSAVVEILQGSILFFVLGSEFFIQYRVVYNSSRLKKDAPAKKEDA